MTRRIDRVNGLLRQEISRVLATELRDPRLSSLVSITHVKTSADLHHAKVYVSVLAEPSVKKTTLQGLKSAAGFIGRTMRGHLTLRNIPQLEFYLDESIEHGAGVLEIIRDVTLGLEDEVRG